MSKTFVAGLLFRDRDRELALILKHRPAWQKGLHNAIGGSVEEGETPLEAMIREFREETGAEGIAWRQFLTLHAQGNKVIFFVGRGDITLHSTTDEPVGWMNLREMMDPVELHGRMIPNLYWIIPMALDRHDIVASVDDPSPTP